jgi:hypothetical protein
MTMMVSLGFMGSCDRRANQIKQNEEINKKKRKEMLAMDDDY